MAGDKPGHGSAGEASVPAGPAHEELRQVPGTAEGHIPPPVEDTGRDNAGESKPDEDSAEEELWPAL
jgi:hypothetical protein